MIAEKNTEVTDCKKPTKVLIVDDQPLVCRGLRNLLGSHAEFEVCGEAGNHHQALKMIVDTNPDLAIVDIILNNSCGLELIKELKTRFPKLLLLVISTHDETVYAERALRAGASGYVSKLETLVNLVEAVKAVLRGEVYVSESIASKLVSHISGHRNSATALVDILTYRELQIFDLIGEGFGPNQIAEKLKINKSTVETYRGRIKKKMRFQDASEMRQKAISWRNGQNSQSLQPSVSS